MAFALGRHFRLPEKARDFDTETVNFFIHAPPILGHIEVLLKLLEHRPEGQKCKVWVFHGIKGKPLEAKLQALGVEYVSLKDQVGEDIDKRALWFRDTFRKEKCGILVWVSNPCWATSMLAMRIAPIQVYYSLRFHPINLPVIDKYITGWGNWDEKEKEYHGQKWVVCPAPLTAEIVPPIGDLKPHFGEQVVLGTIAREEKLTKPFLDCVVRILQQNPNACYIWTGRKEPPEVVEVFEDGGVADRCHFVGWVHPETYIAAMDVFLETFPLGCGIMAYKALGMGKPLVSLQTPYSVFGNTGQNCPTTPDEYVERANELVSNHLQRWSEGVANMEFYDRERNKAAECSKRFFEAVRG